MKLSILDHTEGERTFEINKSKVMGWSYRKRIVLMDLIALLLEPIVRAFGILYMLAGISLFYFMITLRLNIFLESVMGFCVAPMLYFGWGIYKRKIFVNRKKFVDEVTHEIERKIKNKVDTMENEAFVNITQKLTSMGLHGLEGMDMSITEVNTRTGEQRVRKTIKLKKEKKPSVN